MKFIRKLVFKFKLTGFKKMENQNPQILKDILNIINANQFKINTLKKIIFGGTCIPTYEIKEKMDHFLCELEFDFNNIFEIIKHYQIIYEDLSQKVDNCAIKESSLSSKLKELYDELKIVSNNNEKLKAENKILKSNNLYYFYPKPENGIIKNECNIYGNSTSRILDRNISNLTYDIFCRNNREFNNSRLTYEYTNKLVHDYDGYIKLKNKDYQKEVKNTNKISRVNYDYNDYKKYEKQKNNPKILKKSISMKNIETPRDLSFLKEIVENNSKLNLIKKKFGDSIEQKILNKDINDDEIKNIKEYLTELNNEQTSIIPKSKRFILHSNKEKPKRINKSAYKMNNKNENRFVRQMIKNKSFNQLNEHSSDRNST